jgi:hypothetical protein
VAVRSGAIADDLAVDLGAPGLGVLELLQDDDSGASCDHETVPLGIIGA